MLRYKGRLFVIECDTCDDEIESDPGEAFEEFQPRAKRAGWRTKKVAGEWMHGCPKHGV